MKYASFSNLFQTKNQKFYSIFLNFRDHQEIAMSSVVSKQWKGLS